MLEQIFVILLVALILIGARDLVAGICLELQKTLGCPRKIQTGAEALVGQTAIVTHEFTELDGCFQGWVRLNGERWKAVSSSRMVIAKGQKVVVNSVEGLSVVITSLDDANFHGKDTA